SRDHAIEHTPVRHWKRPFQISVDDFWRALFGYIAYSDRSSATAHLSPQTAAEWDHPPARRPPRLVEVGHIRDRGARGPLARQLPQTRPGYQRGVVVRRMAEYISAYLLGIDAV